LMERISSPSVSITNPQMASHKWQARWCVV
jgi:hypothetical protein